MTASSRHHRHTYAEYLVLDEMSNVKLEYLDGEIFAMAGGTPEHAALAMNVGIALAAVRDRGCHVYSSDLRIRVLATGLAVYPDVTVVCGEPEYDPDSATTLVNPALVVEVLSESTREYDRGTKAEHYRRIPSLRMCLLVSSQHRQVEAWRRGDEGVWSLSEHGPGSMLRLAGLGVELGVDEIYRDVLA